MRHVDVERARLKILGAVRWACFHGYKIHRHGFLEWEPGTRTHHCSPLGAAVLQRASRPNGSRSHNWWIKRSSEALVVSLDFAQGFDDGFCLHHPEDESGSDYLRGFRLGACAAASGEQATHGAYSSWIRGVEDFLARSTEATAHELAASCAEARP